MLPQRSTMYRSSKLTLLLQGHDGIIHGGLLATLLDETLARTVSIVPLASVDVRTHPLSSLGHIESPWKDRSNSQSCSQLSCSDHGRPGDFFYKISPLQLCSIALQFIKISTKLVEQKGRRSVVVGRVEDLNGKLLVDATYVTIKSVRTLTLKPTTHSFLQQSNICGTEIRRKITKYESHRSSYRETIGRSSQSTCSPRGVCVVW